MTPLKLDDFSSSVAKLLFGHFPQWEKVAKIEAAEDGSAYLRLEVEAPPESASHGGLSLNTADGQMTVEFDHFRGYFGGQINDGGAEYAVQFVLDLLSEKIPVISWWLNDDLVAWSTIQNGMPLLNEELVQPYDRVRIRSWRGTLNADRDA